MDTQTIYFRNLTPIYEIKRDNFSSEFVHNEQSTYSYWIFGKQKHQEQQKQKTKIKQL